MLSLKSKWKLKKLPFPKPESKQDEIPFDQLKNDQCIVFKAKGSTDPVYQSFLRRAKQFLQENNLVKTMRFEISKIQNGEYGIWGVEIKGAEVALSGPKRRGRRPAKEAIKASSPGKRGPKPKRRGRKPNASKIVATASTKKGKKPIKRKGRRSGQIDGPPASTSANEKTVKKVGKYVRAPKSHMQSITKESVIDAIKKSKNYDLAAQSLNISKKTLSRLREKFKISA